MELEEKLKNIENSNLSEEDKKTSILVVKQIEETQKHEYGKIKAFTGKT